MLAFWTAWLAFAPGSTVPVPAVAATSGLPLPARVIAMDVSPNSLLFLQDHGRKLNFWTGGNLKALWQTIPRCKVNDCCLPLNYLVGGDLMTLWSSVAGSPALGRCVSTVAARTAPITMAEQGTRCLPGEALDFFTGGDLRCLWAECRGRDSMFPRSTAAASRCLFDTPPVDYFAGGDLASLWDAAK